MSEKGGGVTGPEAAYKRGGIRRRGGVCPEPGCPNLNPCSEHDRSFRRRDRETPRPSAAAQGYDAAWRRLRKIHLHRHPLCVVCGAPSSNGRSNHVDHIIPVAAGGPRLDPDNLQTLCHTHHNQKTRDDQKRYRLDRSSAGGGV